MLWLHSIFMDQKCDCVIKTFLLRILSTYHSASPSIELIQSSCIIHSSGSGAVIRSTYSISTTSSWNIDRCADASISIHVCKLDKPIQPWHKFNGHTVDMPSVSMWVRSGVRKNWPLTRKSNSTLLWDAAEKTKKQIPDIELLDMVLKEKRF